MLTTDTPPIRLLADLPTDALQSVISQLLCGADGCCVARAVASVQSAKTLCTVCHSLRTAAVTHEVFWAKLLSLWLHPWRSHEDVTHQAAVASFRFQWLAGRAALKRLPMLTPVTDLVECCSGVASTSSAPLSMPLSRPASRAIEMERFDLAEADVLSKLTKECVAADALAWLLDAPVDDALTQLAVLSALRARLQNTDLSLDALAKQIQWCGPPQSWLSSRLEVKSYTWSQLRDCRGFRARDDVRIRRVTLRELALDDSHEVWGLLARGVKYEVQRITIGVAR